MIDGELRRITSAKVDLTYVEPDTGDWLDVWLIADAATTVPTYAAIDSGEVPGGPASGGTLDRLIGVYSMGGWHY